MKSLLIILAAAAALPAWAQPDSYECQQARRNYQIKAGSVTSKDRHAIEAARADMMIACGQEVGPPVHTQQRRQTTNCTSQIIGNQVHTVCH